MSATEQTVDLDGLRAQIARQGATVRQMKKDGVPQVEVTAQVNILKALKAELAAAEKAVEEEDTFDKAAFEDILKRRMFIVPSFEIYGGVAGLFDFGPPGCALKTNILDVWRQHFILEEDMLHVDCTNLTAEPVLRASGHVDKFTDLMVKDNETGECYRADKLLEGCIDNLLHDSTITSERRRELEQIGIQADAYDAQQLHALLQKFEIKAPSTGNALTEPFPFNLMFQTNIGPEGNVKGFLRPETAQGMFLNFRRLLDYNGGRMPLAAAQIGVGFRNEISPRAGLLRVREFPLAEIEHFCNPQDKSHPKFHRVAEVALPLFPTEHQLGDGKVQTMSMGEAVQRGIVKNETLAYYISRTFLFLQRVGVDTARLRFRQHLPTEMAHYASDCWDAEIHTSYGWVECVGIADRSAFDLLAHMKASKVDMYASERYAEPREVQVVKAKTDNKLLGKTFKREQKAVKEMLAELEVDAAMAIEAELAEKGTAELGPDCDGNSYTLTRSMVSFATSTKRVSEGKFVPAVVEPAFGIGRILYAVMEHGYYSRSDAEEEKRGVMAFRALVAPVKCSVFPLRVDDRHLAAVRRVREGLTQRGISSKVDTTGASIGRRYARTDEIGVPFAITVDPNTVNTTHYEHDTVTLRERDSMEQVRIPMVDVADVVFQLSNELTSWPEVRSEYPVIKSVQDAAAAAAGAASGADAAPAAPSPTGAGIHSLTVVGAERRCGRFARPIEAICGE